MLKDKAEKKMSVVDIVFVATTGRLSQVMKIELMSKSVSW